MRKVLAVAGSSGGHIFPALAFLNSLKERGEIEAVLVLPKKNILSASDTLLYRPRLISIAPLRLSLTLGNLISCLLFLLGSLESMFLLLSFRPQIVVGFGSIVSLPALIFARLMGIKTLIHEQNVIPGRANMFLAGFAGRIAISFAESRDYLWAYRDKVILTGNPLRRELTFVGKERALDFFGLKAGRFTILVIGGSQASSRVNAAFLRSVEAMGDKTALQVIHLSGAAELEGVEKAYKELGVPSRCFAFLNQMQYAYSCADLVISRAGATTISELVFFGLPAVLIPYPYARRHQSANAKVLEKLGAAVIIEDGDLDSGRLSGVIGGLLNNPQRIADMRLSYAHLKNKEAAALLREAVLGVL